jgi:hypothetical protein
MKPSIGRIVHYVSFGTPLEPDGSQAFTSACRAAIITEVGDDDTVSLCVFNPTGQFFNQNVELDADGCVGGSWHWPGRVIE